MGTSNWQQIPFCVDALMKMAPSAVLDIGVGFGRWGVIVREFCDVWYSRVFKDDWKVRVEGIEGFAKNISDYHKSFYDAIHVGDALDLVPALKGPWTVTIYGDVLEHFTKHDARRLLNTSLDRSDYVIVNIPLGDDWPQDELYGNAFERHLSTWKPEEFEEFGLIRRALLKDYIDRPHGSFVLSRRDPKDLRSGLFSKSTDPDSDPLLAASNRTELDHALARLNETAHELSFIKRSESYRLAHRLRRSPVVRALRTITKGPERDVVLVRATARKNPAAKDAECWVLAINSSYGEHPVPWEFPHFSGAWLERLVPSAAYGRAFVSNTGHIRLRTSPDPQLRFLTHPHSGIVEVEFNGTTHTIDLYSEDGGALVVSPGRTPPIVREHAAPPPHTPAASIVAPVVIEAKPLSDPIVNGHVPTPRASEPTFSPDDEAFIERVRRSATRVVAVHCPRWLGVSSSTRILFEHCYAVPRSPDADPFTVPDPELDHHARVLHASGATQIVISGGDEVQLTLADRLHALNPALAIDMLWHGSYIQVAEDYAWHILKLWMNAVRAGRVRSIATVKAGMEDFFRSQGIPSALLLNYVPAHPAAPPRLAGDETHVGLWISGVSARKCPHAMIAALSMMSRPVRLHAAGLEPRARELLAQLGLVTTFVEERPIPQARLMRAIRQTHLSLYVTFSECCPMLPLESLSQGVPCLVGPSSHLFEDNPFLYDRLVVPQPDRADVIARSADRAFAERDDIMAEYSRYVVAYNERARRSVERFLADGPALARGETSWPFHAPTAGSTAASLT